LLVKIACLSQPEASRMEAAIKKLPTGASQRSDLRSKCVLSNGSIEQNFPHSSAGFADQSPLVNSPNATGGNNFVGLLYASLRPNRPAVALPTAHHPKRRIPCVAQN
jgi:hypothetical protein